MQRHVADEWAEFIARRPDIREIVSMGDITEQLRQFAPVRQVHRYKVALQQGDTASLVSMTGASAIEANRVEVRDGVVMFYLNGEITHIYPVSRLRSVVKVNEDSTRTVNYANGEAAEFQIK